MVRLSKKSIINIISVALFLLLASSIYYLKYYAQEKISPARLQGSEEKEQSVGMVYARRLPPGYAHAIWEWDGPTEEAREKLPLLSEKGFKAIYLNIGKLIDIHESSDADKDQKEALFVEQIKKYVEKSIEENLEVHAVFGGPLWGRNSHQYLLPLSFGLVTQYNKDNPSSKIKGIQFDIEPHSINNFDKNQNQEMKSYLQSINLFLHEITTKPLEELEVGLVIPYWYDGENNNISKISLNNESKYPFYHLINSLNKVKNSYVVIMAYRNEPLGEDGTVAHADKEMKFINSFTPRVKMVIAQELENVNPPKVTFYGINYQKFIDATYEICNQFNKYKAFSGLAINNTSSFEKLYKRK